VINIVVIVLAGNGYFLEREELHISASYVKSDKKKFSCTKFTVYRTKVSCCRVYVFMKYIFFQKLY